MRGDATKKHYRDRVVAVVREAIHRGEEQFLPPELGKELKRQCTLRAKATPKPPHCRCCGYQDPHGADFGQCPSCGGRVE